MENTDMTAEEMRELITTPYDVNEQVRELKARLYEHIKAGKKAYANPKYNVYTADKVITKLRADGFDAGIVHRPILGKCLIIGLDYEIEEYTGP